MPYEFLNVRVEGRVGWLEYNRPPVNAINWEMLRELPRALGELLADPEVRVVVFASALERYFNTGADLRVLQAMRGDDMREWMAIAHGLVRQMRASRKPLLAQIHGTAVGGGLEIVTHCDVRRAAADARLGQPEINVGFLPPVGATEGYARLLGRSRALRFLHGGAPVSAEEARAMGLVDVVVPPERLRAEVRAYAAALAEKPAEALAAIRRCITQGIDRPFEEGLAVELTETLRLADTPDFAEGLSAFLEKRPPRWA